MGGFINRDKEENSDRRYRISRKLYRTIECMGCKYKFRTPIYRSGNILDGFGNDVRKESDPCQRCGSRTVL